MTNVVKLKSRKVCDCVTSGPGPAQIHRFRSDPPVPLRSTGSAQIHRIRSDPPDPLLFFVFLNKLVNPDFPPHFPSALNLQRQFDTQTCVGSVPLVTQPCCLQICLFVFQLISDFYSSFLSWIQKSRCFCSIRSKWRVFDLFVRVCEYFHVI